MKGSGDLILGERLAYQIGNFPPRLLALLREELPYLATSGVEDLLVLDALGWVDQALADHLHSLLGNGAHCRGTTELQLQWL